MQFLSKIVLKKFINKEISSIGFDENYIVEASKKHLFLSIKIFNLTSPQANILKQTALSLGCDCAVNKNVVNCAIEQSDCILSGSIKQIEQIAKKLYKQPFSLSKLGDNLLNLVEVEKKPKKSKIVGILNLTHDSFSDGGEFLALDKAMNHAVDMIELGVDIIDIGAQSTRPGADLVSVSFEIEKIIPIVVALKTAYPNLELSVDTMTLACAQASIEAGCDIINDVSFLKNPEFARICAKNDKKLVIMHSRGDTKTMDSLCQYQSLVDDIYKELDTKIKTALEFGLDKKNIIIDIGFGFSKTIEQNFTLLSRINEFKSLGCPILAGVSRKRFLQDVINTKEPKDADIQTLLATSYLIQNEIDYIRVHNVDLTNQATKFNQRLNLNSIL